MTEKRFTTNNGVFYTDNETGWEFQSYGEVVKLMNKLNDENKTFREALKELKEIGDYQAMTIKELDDENQKLKEEIIEWKSKYFEAMDTVINEYSTNIKEDMEELKKEVWGDDDD